MDALVAKLGSDEFQVREEAYRELVSMGAPVLPLLRPHLVSEDPEVARLVRRIFAEVERGLDEELIASLDTQDNAFPDSEAMRRIVGRGRRILPLLFRVLDRADARYPNYDYWRMRNAYAAIGGLVGVGDLDRLLARLDHPNPQHRILLRPILEAFGADRVRPRLLTLLANAKAPARQRAQILELFLSSRLLTGDDDAVRDTARKLLSDPAGTVRAAAVRWFWLKRDGTVAGRILALAGDKVPEVRAAALRALRTYPSEPAEVALREALRDPVPIVRAAALETMRGAVEPDMGPLVSPYLEDPDPTVRANAAQLLGQLGYRSALPVLLRLLKERNEDFLSRTLYAVVDAVGRLGDPAAVEPLFELLEDAGASQAIRNYRYQILSAIVRSGGEKVLSRIRPYLADASIQNRNVVLDAIGRLRSRAATPILLDALKGTDTRMRTSAVRALADRGYAAAAPLIAKALLEEKDAWFLSEAVRALSRFGYEKAVPAMRKLLEEDASDIRRSSLFYALIRAMVRFRVGDAAPRIARLALTEPNFLYLGVDALGRLADPRTAPTLEKIYERNTNETLRFRIAVGLARMGRKQRLLERLGGLSERNLTEALLALGRLAEARTLVEEGLARHPGDPSRLYDLACVLSLSGDRDRALETLGKALERRTFSRDAMLTDPDLFPIRDDPRFAKLLTKAR